MEVTLQPAPVPSTSGRVDGALRITEIFLSLQGESSTIGMPTTFVRLTGCPLRCVYCDTAYAFKGGRMMTRDEVLSAVAGQGVPHVCVTGGEPLAQPGCNALLQALVEEGYLVSLETSGAFPIGSVPVEVTVVMDLKTPSSGEMHRNLMNNIAALRPHHEVKFVIGGAEDYAWAVAQLREHRLSERVQVLFSPIKGAQDPTELADWIVRDRLPVRFQVQLHKILWADEAGR